MKITRAERPCLAKGVGRAPVTGNVMRLK